MATEIQPDVYDITTRRDANGLRYRVYLFDDEVSVLVDTGHADTVKTLFGELDELGVVPDRVLITHGHHDHVGGVDAIVDRYDADLFAPERAEIRTDARPDVRFADGDLIEPFTAVHVPGHTPHHYAFVHNDLPIAVLGDALFGSDFRGLPAGYFVLPPGVYSEDLNQADVALKRLLRYEFEIALLSHGTSVTENSYEKLESFVDFPGK